MDTLRNFTFDPSSFNRKAFAELLRTAHREYVFEGRRQSLDYALGVMQGAACIGMPQKTIECFCNWFSTWPKRRKQREGNVWVPENQKPAAPKGGRYFKL